ncbi:MAG TPA: gliding motility-associated C-terminal domain-containing protein [Bacteroidales bacterium]|nr:gliding motility-associated C-terminal domain-containing protein [Bacteroidales bacterium]HRZ75910.1 gliding motility-associated C-terminal domain-containing protein [Bacteroidales bacterium]
MILRHLTYGAVSLLMFFPGMGSAQYLSNPSFEGPVVMHQAPPGWNPCDPRSTPDTQPGVWGHTLPAADGRTYLSMVTRGDWGPNANSTEDCETELQEPLSPDQCYELRVALATCEDCGHDSEVGWISYAHAVRLNLYLGTETCRRDLLLASFGPVEQTLWTDYSLRFSPPTPDYRYLILEADWEGMPEYFGTVVVDNLRLSLSTTSQHMLDHTLQPGDTLRLKAGQGDHWLWSPPEGLSCVECPSPLLTFQEDITYTVLVRDSAAVCPWYQTYRIWEEASVYVPNAFSPDGDGLNDRFGPVFRGSVVRMEFSVYDRLGMPVFTAHQPGEHWDGLAAGRPVPVGVYPWVLEYGVHVRMGWQMYRRTGMVVVVR